MKKSIYHILLLFATIFVLGSCENVPAPYILPGSEENGGEHGGNTPETGDYLNETFATSFGKFKAVTVKGASWNIDFKCAKGTGYNSAEKKTTPSEAYLVSEPADLSKSKGAYLEFGYILRYFTNFGQPVQGLSDKVLITDNYTNDPTTTKWTDISGKLIEGKDWETWTKYSVNIPADFIGKDKVVIAFLFTCEKSSATWEIKNLTLREGKTGNNGDNDNPGTQTNGDGTKDNPYNVAAALKVISELPSGKNTSKVYVKGKISSIKSVDTGQFGNAEFKISDDGKTENELIIYRAFYLDNKHFTSADQIKVGDNVVIYGPLTNFMGNTPETVATQAYIYAINGKTSSDDNHSSPAVDAKGDGTKDNPYNVTAALSKTSSEPCFTTGYIVGCIEGKSISSGAKFTNKNITGNTNILIAASPDETNIGNCLPVQLPYGKVREGVNLVQNPDNYKKVVLLYGTLQKYFGVPGIKSVTYAVIDSKQIGTEPAGK